MNTDFELLKSCFKGAMSLIIINLTSAPTSRNGSSNGQNAADRAHAWDKSSSVQLYISSSEFLRYLLKFAKLA